MEEQGFNAPTTLGFNAPSPSSALPLQRGIESREDPGFEPHSLQSVSQKKNKLADEITPGLSEKKTNPAKVGQIARQRLFFHTCYFVHPARAQLAYYKPKTWTKMIKFFFFCKGADRCTQVGADRWELQDGGYVAQKSSCANAGCSSSSCLPRALLDASSVHPVFCSSHISRSQAVAAERPSANPDGEQRRQAYRVRGL
ncbi:uncharacterized protein [Miscanthus floridulus]|uniref:uncharacterized protein n=1 Tax=Miscanthus floridulus TaxID=154761 RepID=UPI003459A395